MCVCTSCSVCGLFLTSLFLCRSAAVFADGTLTTQWDEMFDRGEKLETFDLATDVGFNLYKAPMLVSQRDIVAVGRSYVSAHSSIAVC